MVAPFAVRRHTHATPRHGLPPRPGLPATLAGMHPDERTLAAAMKRTLAVAHGAKPRADVDNGWSAHRGGLAALLGGLLDQTAPRPLIQLHEQGADELEEVLRAERRPAQAAEAGRGDAHEDGASSPPGAVLVFGDQLGCARAASHVSTQAHLLAPERGP